MILYFSEKLYLGPLLGLLLLPLPGSTYWFQLALRSPLPRFLFYTLSSLPHTFPCPPITPSVTELLCRVYKLTNERPSHSYQSLAQLNDHLYWAQRADPFFPPRSVLKQCTIAEISFSWTAPPLLSKAHSLSSSPGSNSSMLVPSPSLFRYGKKT